MEKTKRIIKLGAKDFRRLVGVKKEMYRDKIEVEEMVLMTLEYWREYRTYFHIGINYGVSESCAYKKIRFVEEELIKSEKFRL
jgi:hypothetical protein